MQNSKLARFLIIAMATFFIIFVLSLILVMQQPNFQRSGGIAVFVEISFSWIRQFTGLALIIFSVISLIIEDTALMETKNLAKWITFVILGILIIHTIWYLVLAIVIILIVLIVIDFLRDRNKNIETSQ
ncbi:MAG: hypothetical protein JXA96_06820 [Sedimentisphaerales bacterium]|nr:hypothetical protein [Sedimentisphaerales bacterium]